MRVIGYGAVSLDSRLRVYKARLRAWQGHAYAEMTRNLVQPSFPRRRESRASPRFVEQLQLFLFFLSANPEISIPIRYRAKTHRIFSINRGEYLVVINSFLFLNPVAVQFIESLRPGLDESSRYGTPIY